MKKVLLSAAIFSLTATAFAQKKVDEIAKFTTDVITFGKFKQNTTGADSLKATAVFTITNISNQPLIIADVKTTCGCTVGVFTQEPIAPGKTGQINAAYNAANTGHFEKTLTVVFAGSTPTNPIEKPIKLVGDVVSAEDYAKLSPAEKGSGKGPGKPAKKS